MPMTPYEETADTRPRVRRDVLFTETPKGVVFHNADGGFQFSSPKAYRFATLLVPHLDGNRTVAEICSGFGEPQKAMVGGLVKALYARGFARPVPAPSAEADGARVEPAVAERFAEQIAYLDHYADGAEGRFARFRGTRVAVLGDGDVARWCALSLVRNGCARVGVQTALAEGPATAAEFDRLRAEAARLTGQGSPAEVAVLPPRGPAARATGRPTRGTGWSSPHAAGTPSRPRWRCSGRACRRGACWCPPGPSAAGRWSARSASRARPDAWPAPPCDWVRRGTRPSRRSSGAGWRWGPGGGRAARAARRDARQPPRLRGVPAGHRGASRRDPGPGTAPGHGLLRRPGRAAAAPSALSAVPDRAGAPEPVDLAAAPGRPAFRPVVAAAPDDGATEGPLAELDRRAVAVRPSVGVFTRYADEPVTQTPLKVGAVEVGLGPAGTRIVAAFDVHHTAGARLRALNAAAEVYAEHVVPAVPAPADADGAVRTVPEALTTATGAGAIPSPPGALRCPC
ncbi:hypothetical protein ACRAR1_25935 [Streptomyces sanyensis]|uniref:hypothetical protein n=1 Tax=Streptomyces sanyensis TaxID=568869 RepID=UPI003D780C9E